MLWTLVWLWIGICVLMSVYLLFTKHFILGISGLLLPIVFINVGFLFIDFPGGTLVQRDLSQLLTIVVAFLLFLFFMLHFCASIIVIKKDRKRKKLIQE